MLACDAISRLLALELHLFMSSPSLLIRDVYVLMSSYDAVSKLENQEIGPLDIIIFIESHEQSTCGSV